MPTDTPLDTFANPWPPREDVRITSVRAITTAPEGTALVVVRQSVRCSARPAKA